jgi:Kef-type K+ transport system membrane component KefB/voltage-gated potassium channel Kch
MFFGLPFFSSIAIGLALSMSSTAIALQSLKEKGWLVSPAGQSSFAVLLFQDLSVIPILAILPLLVVFSPEVASHQVHGLEKYPAWVSLGGIFLAVGLVVVGGKYLLRPIFRLIASTGLREIFTATALLLVIGTALLMEAVGLSAALGTFLAGVVLAENEYRHELESDIEPFKGLLLGLFFIAVGAEIDFIYIGHHLALVGALCVGLLLIKGLVLWVLGKFYGLENRQALLFPISLSQVGEFAFVLIGLSLEKGVITKEWSLALISVTVVSMLSTPLLYLLFDRFAVVSRSSVASKKEADVIEKKAPVILAGFGRMGNIIGRLLRANGIETNVLDLNPGLIENVRKLGLKAHYGDANRLDLLQSAGAHEAKVLIIAIDVPEKAVELAKLAKHHFPHLKIIARSKDRRDAYALVQMGVSGVVRETFGSAIEMSYQTLVALGFRTSRAHRAVQAFKKYNEEAMREIATQFQGEKEFFKILKEKIKQEEGMLTDKEIDLDLERAWDNESLKNEYLATVLAMKKEKDK